MGFSYDFIPAPPVTPQTPPEDIFPSSEWLNEHNGGNLIGICVAFMVLTLLFVVLRFWSRRIQRGAVGIDDYVIYPALFSCWLTQIMCIAIVPNGGVGTHAAYWAISDQRFVLVEWIKYIFAVEMCALLAMCLTKLAILSIYIRILRDSISLKVAYACIAITLGAWVANWIACSLQCIPFEYQWDKTIPGGHCFNQLAFYQYLSIPNIVTDVVLLVLPFPTILKLHTSRIQKLQLAAAFLTGSFGIVSSILRFSNFVEKNALSDPTYNSIVLLTWTVIEPSMYLISACLPVLRPLLDRGLQKANVGSWSVSSYLSNRYGARSGHSTMPRSQAIELNSERHPSIEYKYDDNVAFAGGYQPHAAADPFGDRSHGLPPKGQILETKDVTLSHSDGW